MVTLKNWHITYFNDAAFLSIKELPIKIRARYFALTDAMEARGPNLGMPHTRAMGNGLFELRIKALEGIARVFFCLGVEREIIMLHAFIKKTDKTPKKELNIAVSRLNEVLYG